MKHLILAIAAIGLASCTCAGSGKHDCATCNKAAAGKPEICKMCNKPMPNCCCKKKM